MPNIDDNPSGKHHETSTEFGMRVDSHFDFPSGVYIAKFPAVLESGETRGEAIENLRRVLVSIGERAGKK